MTNNLSEESNKNAGNTSTTNSGRREGSKRFIGENANLSGRNFDVSSKRDTIHQFADTIKAIANYVGQAYTHGGDIHQ
jgi:hypothetical protein